MIAKYMQLVGISRPVFVKLCSDRVACGWKFSQLARLSLFGSDSDFFGGSATQFPRVSGMRMAKGLVVETYPLVRIL